MHDQGDKNDKLLRYIYELSRGDTELPIRRKHLGEQLGLSSREAKAALKALKEGDDQAHSVWLSLHHAHRHSGGRERDRSGGR